MKNQLQKICNFFNFGNIESTTKAGGNANDNYFVKTNKGDFFIKIILEQYGIEDKLNEQKYLSRLAENNVSIIKYLTNDSEEIICNIDGKIAVAQEKIEALSIEPLNDGEIQKIGLNLALLHNVPTDGLPNKKHWLSENYLPDAIQVIKSNFNQSEDIFKIIDLYNALPKDLIYNLPKSIIHGDLYLDNILIKKDDGNIIFIDWEEIGVGVSLLDFGMAIIGCCFQENIFNKECYENLYKSYTVNRMLSQEENDNIINAVKYAAVTTAVWRFLHNNYYHPSNELKDRYKLFWECGSDYMGQLENLVQPRR